MKKLIVLLITFLSFQIGFSQNDNLFERLRAIDNSGITFYNVDGINFSRQIISSEYNDKNLKKAFRQYKIKKSDKKETDNAIELTN